MAIAQGYVHCFRPLEIDLRYLMVSEASLSIAPSLLQYLHFPGSMHTRHPSSTSLLLPCILFLRIPSNRSKRNHKRHQQLILLAEKDPDVVIVVGGVALQRAHTLLSSHFSLTAFRVYRRYDREHPIQ
jgi:hypothetical protein